MRVDILTMSLQQTNKDFIINYFKSASFLGMVALFFSLVGLGLAYDHFFPIVTPFTHHTISDLTIGDIITAGGILLFIFSIPVTWIINSLREKEST